MSCILVSWTWTSNAMPHQWSGLCIPFGLQFGTTRLCGWMLRAGIWLAGGNRHCAVNPSVGFMLHLLLISSGSTFLSLFFRGFVFPERREFVPFVRWCPGFFFFFFHFKLQERMSSLVEVMSVELLWWYANSFLSVSLPVVCQHPWEKCMCFH